MTRNNFNGKKVEKLYYECYEAMAVKQMQDLATKAIVDFGLKGFAIYHRLGEVVRLLYKIKQISQ